MSTTLANPPPDPSSLSNDVLQLSVTLDTKNYLSTGDLKSIQLFRRAANYISAGIVL
jgi:xylulose-5-phosphate/fructose-6-phosphate phosphoketolase